MNSFILLVYSNLFLIPPRGHASLRQTLCIIIIANGPPHLVLLVEAEGKAEHVVVGVERGLVVEHVVYRHSLPLGPDTELSRVRIRGSTRGLYAFSPLGP
jgi:hypothetical protein